MNTQVLGISVDHIPCLEAWQESLGGISYPLMSDFWPHGKVSKLYGVFLDDGRSARAIFLIDKEGIIRYIDIHDIDDQPDNQVLFDQIKLIDPESAKRSIQSEVEEELPSGDVVMYCTSWCPDCKKARVWLKENDIDYLEVDVNQYPEAAKLVRSWANGNLVTPTFNIRGHIIVDYDLPELRKVLNITE